MTDLFIHKRTLDESIALEFRALLEVALPQAPLTKPKDTLAAFKMMTAGYEDCLFLAERSGVIVGFVMLMRGPSPELARPMGGVLPTEQRAGIGTQLWQRMLTELKKYPLVKRLQCRTFGSLASSRSFLEHMGGVNTERVYWLERPLDEALSVELQAKLDRLKSSSIKVISAQDFITIRPDWDRVWWKLETEASRDIPTSLGVMQPSFEEWRDAMNTFTPDLNEILIAIDGAEPVGVMKLRQIKEGCININFTAVAATHRRRGISSLLKYESIQLARSLGAERLSTQNHSTNTSIINANLSFGFREQDQMLDYVFTL